MKSRTRTLRILQHQLRVQAWLALVNESCTSGPFSERMDTILLVGSICWPLAEKMARRDESHGLAVPGWDGGMVAGYSGCECEGV